MSKQTLLTLHRIALVLVLWPGLILIIQILCDLINIAASEIADVRELIPVAPEFWRSVMDTGLASSSLGLILFSVVWLVDRHANK